MARMLGTIRQPFCGKCCGYHTKAGNQIAKRAQKRADRNELKKEVVRGEHAW